MELSIYPHKRAALPTPRAAQGAALRIGWALDTAALREAQALRYEVFALEQGAQLRTAVQGLDADEFDPFCDHVLVRDAASGLLLGTCRLLPPVAARRSGRGYAESEFDLQALAAWRPRMLEMGRTCIRRGHRGGAVLLGLWSAVAAQMQALRLDMLLGCTSVSLADGGATARALLHSLDPAQWLSPAQQARPLQALPEALPARGDAGLAAEGRALLLSYLRFGAKVCAAPAWDRQFGVADFLTLLDLRDMPERHRRHFLSRPGGATGALVPAAGLGVTQ